MQKEKVKNVSQVWLRVGVGGAGESRVGTEEEKSK
jgi:hypothetical protein